MKPAIGGYFELELQRARPFMYQGAQKYQSARSALLALLRAAKPKRVWMPYYICDVMLAPVRAFGAEICFYSLDKQLGIADDITLTGTDLLLYVNYFGVCLGQVEKVLARFNPSQVVMDFSQAFFTKPQNCLATIYSPRKFFGLPDGGLLFSQLAIDLPEAIDEGSENRTRHLIARLGGAVELGYVDYKLAEATLNELEPKRMSQLTERIFGAIDFDAVRARRNENYNTLHANLSQRNGLKIDLKDVNGPMCYPYLSDSLLPRAALLADRIFIPTYWPDILSRADIPRFEGDLVNKIHALPCDQRYDKNDMSIICGRLLEFNE